MNCMDIVLCSVHQGRNTSKRSDGIYIWMSDMLEVKNHLTIDKGFLFVAAFLDRLPEMKRTASMAKMNKKVYRDA